MTFEKLFTLKALLLASEKDLDPWQQGLLLELKRILAEHKEPLITDPMAHQLAAKTVPYPGHGQAKCPITEKPCRR